MTSRYYMEFVLSHWWLFDKEWRKSHPDTFNEGTKGKRVATTTWCGEVDDDGNRIYEEEWSTI